MATPYLAEIRIFSFAYPPKGWALCNGQLLSTNEYSALFSLLGTYYGGDGVKTFALPNLQGNIPIHMGTGYAIGQTGGEQNHTLLASEMPQHTHPVVASANPANQGSAAGNYWANGNQPAYAASPNAQMAGPAVSVIGGSQPHNNLSPYLTLNFCIATAGICPG